MNNDPLDSSEPIENSLESAARNLNEMAYRAALHFEDSLNRAKTQASDLQHSVVDRTSGLAREADYYVHENPWRSVGIAAGIGLILGLLLRR